jgi:DNA-binding transcriptional MerR regulator
MMAGSVLPPTETPEIPNKLYFRIGDVSKLAGVKSFVLRYWETEFPQLSPKKSGTGQRLYRRKDVETVLEIKRLLYQERFTIEGARNFLQSKSEIRKPADKGKAKKQQMSAPPPPEAQGDLFGAPAVAVAVAPPSQSLEISQAPPAGLDEVRRQLREILDILR